MVLKKGKIVIIGHPVETIPAKCEDCGQMDELRPYGRNGANVCFDCAMKDEANAAEMFRRQVEGDS
jgi:hypothetical protein